MYLGGLKECASEAESTYLGRAERAYPNTHIHAKRAYPHARQQGFASMQAEKVYPSTSGQTKRMIFDKGQRGRMKKTDKQGCTGVSGVPEHRPNGLTLLQTTSMRCVCLSSAGDVIRSSIKSAISLAAAGKRNPSIGVCWHWHKVQVKWTSFLAVMEKANPQSIKKGCDAVLEMMCCLFLAVIGQENFELAPTSIDCRLKSEWIRQRGGARETE